MNSFIKKRSITGFILLGLITIGIYWIVEFCIFGKEVNELCEGDSQDNMHYLLALLLGMVTLGIYPIYWFYKAIKRLEDNGYRYKVVVKNTASNYILWTLLGIFLFGIGPIVGFCMLVSDLNQFSDVAGYFEPFPYTPNIYERQQYSVMQLQPANAMVAGSNFIANPVGETIPLVDHSGVPSSLQKPVVEPRKREILGIGGECDGYKIPVSANDEIIIGRDPNQCNIVLSSNTVSAKHAVIRWDAGNDKYIVLDCSTNGVFMDGARLEPNQSVFVDYGKQITIGKTNNSFLLS